MAVKFVFLPLVREGASRMCWMSRKRNVSLADVAKEAGVALSTASRALNATYGVAPATREKVLEAATRLDFVASPDARVLAKGSSRRVALVVPHINRWFFGEMVNGIERVTAEAEVDLLLYHVDDENHRRGFFEKLPARRLVEAMVIVAFPVDEEEALRLEKMGVIILAAGGQSTHYPHVCIDDYAAAKTAVEHLTDLGHRKIAMLSSREPAVPNWPLIPGRRQGYFDALAEVGAVPEPEWLLEVDWGEAQAVTAVLKLAERDILPTALFAHSDELALAAIGALQSVGLRVPEDISVIGIDDHPLASPLGLSTVRQDPFAQGELVGHMVLQALGVERAGEPIVSTVMETELVARRSTAPPGR